MGLVSSSKPAPPKARRVQREEPNYLVESVYSKSQIGDIVKHACVALWATIALRKTQPEEQERKKKMNGAWHVSARVTETRIDSIIINNATRARRKPTIHRCAQSTSKPA